MSDVYEFDKEQLFMGDRVSDEDWGDFIHTNGGTLDKLIRMYFREHYVRFLGIE